MRPHLRAAGVRVYSPAGRYLGRFGVPGGVSNLCFGGRDGRSLLLLSETRAYLVRMRVRGGLESEGGGRPAEG